MTPTWQERSKDEDNNDMCASCGFPSRSLKSFRYGFSHNRDTEERLLCDLCAGSFAGNAEEYPSLYPGGYVLQSIMFAANVLREELGEA